MKVLILLSIVVIALAAPARAWCEATCTQPAADQKSHCPAHTHGSGTSIAAADQDQCRAIDAARTQSPARLSSAAPAPAFARLNDHGELRRGLAEAAFGRVGGHLRTLTPSHPVPLRI